MATDKVKKVIIWVVFAFIIYAIFTDPQRSAGIVHDIVGILSGGVTNIGKFFHTILHG